MLLTPSLSANESDYSVGEIGPEEITDSLFINGTVFHDANSNGVMEAGEPGLSGWTIRLARDDAEISNVTSDELGGYIFEGLGPGSYMVSEDLMPEWNQTAPGGGVYQITLVDKNGHRYDFGNSRGVVERALIGYPLMRPSMEELQRWIDQYNESPRALLNPQIERDLEASPMGSLSLLNHLQYTPSERNQGPYCGNCWVWAGTGVMEIGLSVEEGVKDRLSIQYLNSNFNSGSGNEWACCGGSIWDVADFYGGMGKAIPWTNANAHWQDQGRSCADGSSSVPASSISISPDYPIASIEAQAITTWNVGNSTAISNIKNVLNQNKAVFFGFALPSNAEWYNFFDFWDLQPETSVWDPTFSAGKAWNKDEGAGHAVLCVGYDDTDPNNRYWIMVNSWGTNANRPNGLFRVDMDMNYDCYSLDGSDPIPAFYWETLDLEYELPEYTKDTVGVFDPSFGIWFLDYDNNGVADDAFYYGATTHKPVSGDWDGDGKDTAGVFDPATSLWFLDNNNDGAADQFVYYGASTHIPVTGDWDGDGADTVGVFDPTYGIWFLDYDNNGVADAAFYYGAPTHKPVVGDWNGDGMDTVGVFDPATSSWFLDNNNDGVADQFVYYGASSHIPVTGDWDGDGTDTVGVFDPSTGLWFLDNDSDGVADQYVYFGASSHIPVTGNWYNV